MNIFNPKNQRLLDIMGWRSDKNPNVKKTLTMIFNTNDVLGSLYKKSYLGFSTQTM